MDNNSLNNGAPSFLANAAGINRILKSENLVNSADGSKPYTEAEIEKAMNEFKDGNHSDKIKNTIKWRSE